MLAADPRLFSSLVTLYFLVTKKHRLVEIYHKCLTNTIGFRMKHTVLAPFLHCDKRIPNRSHLREERIGSQFQGMSIHVWWQEHVPETAHAFEDKKQRALPETGRGCHLQAQLQ